MYQVYSILICAYNYKTTIVLIDMIMIAQYWYISIVQIMWNNMTNSRDKFCRLTFYSSELLFVEYIKIFWEILVSEFIAFIDSPSIVLGCSSGST